MVRLCSLLIAAFVAVGVAGCGPDEARRAPLAQLVALAADYDGHRVTTKGTVRTYREPRHYWIEDEDYHRVALEPPSAVSSLVGERVQVTGRFSYGPDKGRAIRVETIWARQANGAR